MSIHLQATPSHIHTTFHTIDGSIYVSPYSTILPNLVYIDTEIDVPQAGLRRRWAYDDLFYLAFIPERLAYTGPVLGSLDRPAAGIERIIVPGEYNKVGNPLIRYRLAPDIQKQWSCLEQILLCIHGVLSRELQLFHWDTAVLWEPSVFPYMQNHKSLESAQRAVSRACTAFTLRLALLSFCVLKLSKGDLQNDEVWLSLSSVHKIPLAVCRALQMSWVGDWTVPRVGAFVDIM